MSQNVMYTSSRISARVTIDRDVITCDEDFFVDAKVNVAKIDVKQHTLVIGKTCTYEGDLYGGVIQILGTFTGNAYGTSLIELGESAHVTGDMHAPKYEIDNRAKFNGRMNNIT